MGNDATGTDAHLVGEADADLSEKQYFAAIVTTTLPSSLSYDFGVNLAGVGAIPDGIIQEPAALGKGVTLRTMVPVPVIGIAGAAITVGATLVVTAAGKFIVSSSGTVGDAIVAKALGAASGDLARFSLLPGNYGTV